MRELLRVSDVAPALGVTPARVYQLIEAGDLPAVRRGRAVRIPRAAWQRWLDEQTERAEAQRRERREATR